MRTRAGLRQAATTPTRPVGAYWRDGEHRQQRSPDVSDRGHPRVLPLHGGVRRRSGGEACRRVRRARRRGSRGARREARRAAWRRGAGGLHLGTPGDPLRRRPAGQGRRRSGAELGRPSAQGRNRHRLRGGGGARGRELPRRVAEHRRTAVRPCARRRRDRQRADGAARGPARWPPVHRSRPRALEEHPGPRPHLPGALRARRPSAEPLGAHVLRQARARTSAGSSAWPSWFSRP